MMTAKKFILLTLLFALPAFSADTDTFEINFDKISKESVNVSGNGAVTNNCEAVAELKLDFIALVFDMVISLEQDVGDDKFLALRNSLYELNPVLFNQVEEKRFASINNLMWHPFADKTVTQFKNIAFKYFKPQLPIEKIKSDLLGMNKAEIKKYVHDMMKRLANEEMLCAIVNLWSTELKGEEKDATIECNLQ